MTLLIKYVTIFEGLTLGRSSLSALVYSLKLETRKVFHVKVLEVFNFRIERYEKPQMSRPDKKRV